MEAQSETSNDLKGISILWIVSMSILLIAGVSLEFVCGIILCGIASHFSWKAYSGLAPHNQKVVKNLIIAITAIIILGSIANYLPPVTSSSSSSSPSFGKGDRQKQMVIMGCSKQCEDFKDKDLRQNCFQTCINLNGR